MDSGTEAGNRWYFLYSYSKIIKDKLIIISPSHFDFLH